MVVVGIISATEVGGLAGIHGHAYLPRHALSIPLAMSMGQSCLNLQCILGVSLILSSQSLPLISPCCTVNTCTNPSDVHTCSFGGYLSATMSTAGSCDPATCASNYSGTASTAFCSVVGGAWSFTDTCTGELRSPRSEHACLLVSGSPKASALPRIGASKKDRCERR